MLLKNRNISSKIKRSNVTDYAALGITNSLHTHIHTHLIPPLTSPFEQILSHNNALLLSVNVQLNPTGGSEGEIAILFHDTCKGNHVMDVSDKILTI